MRKVLLVLGIVIGILVIGIGLFAATFDVNRYHDRIQSELENRLGRKVSLGQMHLGLFPPRFRVQDLAIADDPRFNDLRPFVQTQELDVSLKLLPLLDKSVEIDSLNLTQPRVELIRNREGVWNFASLGSSPASSPPNPASVPSAGSNQPRETSKASGAPSSPEQQLSLSKLAIQDGQIAVTDQKKENRSVYDHIDVTLQDFAPNQPFSLDVAAHLPGTGAQEIRLQGKGGPIAQNQPAATPFQGTLSLKQVTIAGFQQFLNSPALANTDGVLSGETKLSSEAGKLSASGQSTAQNLKVHGTELGYPVAADYDISDDVAADLLTIRSTTIKLGSMPLGISGTVNSAATPAKLDLNLKAASVSIAEAVKLAAASGIAFSPGITVNGWVSADIQARGDADRPALSGTINGRDLEASGKELARPVQVKAVNLTLTPEAVRSDNFNVTSGGTTVATQFAVRQYTAKSPVVDATLRAPNAGLPELLSMAKAYGVTALDRVNGQGTLNLDMHASGPVQSFASDAIAKALNGTLNLNFNNVRYSGVDISHELASIGGFLKSQGADQGATNISRMSGNIVVKNGVAQTNNLQALLDMGNVGATGTANLGDQTLNLRVTAVLSKSFSQQVGGTGVGGYLQTALANNQGELVIPAIVTGTFQKPRFAPDLQQVAQMKLKGLMPNFSNPQSAVSGLLGGLLGQKNANQTNGNQSQQQIQQQQNPVQQLMGIFGKKKQQPSK
jgi:AsmA protein